MLSREIALRYLVLNFLINVQMMVSVEEALSNVHLQKYVLLAILNVQTLLAFEV